jgi:autotransporter strand-loop-strand O-heptosyltransferase
MNNGHYDFIEIGTSDFDTLIENANDETIGLSVEPIKYYLDRLPNRKNVKKLQYAISDNDGYIEIYYIPEEKIIEHQLKWWVRGSNSVGRPHQFALKELGEEFYNSIVKIDTVPTLCWETFVKQQNIKSINYLKIDTEGYDHVILNDYLKMCEQNPSLLAEKIKFERHPEVSKMDDIDNIIPKFKNYHVEYNETDVVLTKIKIPKIIHQTFRTKDIPKEIKSSIDELRAMNPDYEYRFYDDNDCLDFIKNNYDEETLTLYKSINSKYGSAKSDFFRYLIMYKLGGVYLDLKSSTTKPLNQTILPNDEFLLTHWEGRDWRDILNYYHGEFQNWHIICAPNHPFLEKTIELVKQNIKNYNGETGKNAVLNLTGPIAYSKAILSVLDKYRTYSADSPVREFKLENEINLTYMNLKNPHHSELYGTNVSNDEPIIISENKLSQAFLLYSTENYLEIVTECAKSIREFSELPIIVYVFNSDKKIEVKNTITVKWDFPIDDLNENLYFKSGDNFYIDRKNPTIYKILTQRPLIAKDALSKYADTICYVDSDSIATPLVDTIFSYFKKDSSFPYFVESVYQFLTFNGRGKGGPLGGGLNETLEHNACDLFGVDQSVRQNYRQTGYFVAGQNTYDFLDEWYWMCNHPKVLNNISHYAPYDEETIANVLLWKYNIQEGLPYIYVNGTVKTVNKMYNEVEYKGDGIRNFQGDWLRVPYHKEHLLFFHGEKNTNLMREMVEEIKKCNTPKLKILFLAPHLSTGGMPSYLLKRIESLLQYTSDIEIFVTEFCEYSTLYTVQRNRIKELIPEKRFWTINTLDSHNVENSMRVIDIIKNNSIDIVHIDEMIEGFDSFNKVPNQLKNALYENDRTWRVVETCHNIWFDPDTQKQFHPDAYALCTPYHLHGSFKNTPSHKEVFEFPIENKFRSREEQIECQKILGLDSTKIHVINVGLWTSGKNQGEGIEIARHFQDRNVEFHFVGNQASNFESYWGPLMSNLPSNVRIWGERSDVETFMKASDILMFNSTWECNPLVIREAASLGLKIIARDLPQYVGMFDKIITPLSDEILTNVGLLRKLISSTRNYQILDGMTENFAEKHYNLYKFLLTQEPRKKSKNNSKVHIKQFFINEPFLEIMGDSDSEYDVKFFDEFGVCHYHNKLKSNHWIKLNRRYFTKWNTKILEDGVLMYDKTLDYTGKRVFINFDSSSLGDTISWIPYVLEFKNVHQCDVIVSTHLNHLFRDVYPELEFVEPGNVVHNIHGQYNLGWFYDVNKEPELPNTIPLQQAATNILGLPYTEIKPRISYKVYERPYEEKYITIATNSTAGCKFWTREGWQELINYLHSLGYKVINVSKEDNKFNNCEKVKNTEMDYTMNVIHHSEFFIGLSSGLSWLSWAMGKHVVMISNFTESNHEFTSNCTRITNPNVCNGCWNSPIHRFDKGDWNWCPVHKGTSRQFECHTSITSEMVINQIKHLLK